jgi:ketosteroid isomerase-like protein
LFTAENGEGGEASAAARLDLRNERAALLATDQRFAAAAANVNLVDAIVAPLASDAVFVVASASPDFVRGPEAARLVLLANPSNATAKWTWTAIRVDVSSNGRRGYTYGYAEATLASGAKLPAKYLAFWGKQQDGTWKMAAYKRVGRLPGAVSSTPPAGFESPDYPHYRYFANTDPASELAVVKSVDQAFSDLAQVVGNGDAFGTYAAPDGANAAGARSAPWVFGPDAIRAIHASDPLGGFYWTPELGDVAQSGDLGFTVGNVKVDTRGADGTVTTAIIGKYLTIWKKQYTGDWRFVVDG